MYNVINYIHSSSINFVSVSEIMITIVESPYNASSLAMYLITVPHGLRKQILSDGAPILTSHTHFQLAIIIIKYKRCM